jgi:tripartite-type tricarboxylate transporter receptor subunit TctC
MDSGKLRALAVADSKRHAAFPDVPSFAELGYSDLEFRAWTAVLAPAGTPQPVIDHLEKRLRAAMQSRDVMQRFAALKIDIAFGDPQSLGSIIRRESAQWKPLIETLGLGQE